jgi:hypothetical protein
VGCGVPDVSVHKFGVPPGRLRTNVAGPAEGNVNVGTGEIWIGLGPGTPMPPAPVAGAEGRLLVDPGDGAAGLGAGDDGNGTEKDCPCSEDVVADDGPLIEEEVDVPGTTVEVVELFDGEGPPERDELGRAGGSADV